MPEYLVRRTASRAMPLAVWLAALLLSAGAAPARAQPGAVPQQDGAVAAAPSAGRPRIGLVLSGGGARGGAHVGVLKALEELHVPIDYVVGTSIGAIVGGFYVSGMTTDDLDALVASIEWNTAFRNTAPRRLKSFRRKRDDDLFLVDQQPGVRDGEFLLPAGFIQGQVIDTIISRETLRASGVGSFDDLAIPFRAVTADIATGEAVVLGTGSLPLALRASMSIPALLTPVEIDGRLLVDGGIVMNLPVEVALAMGADIVIAVDISSELIGRDNLRSVLDVTSQLTNLLMLGGLKDQREMLRESDVHLTPTFPADLGSTSFDRMSETIQAGYDAAMANRAELERLALDDIAYGAHLEARPSPRMDELPVVEFVALDNNSPIADSVIETRLKDIAVGEPLDVEQVETAMNRVYGLEYFENVRYSLTSRPDGAAGLEVVANERSWGPDYLQLGMQYASAGDQDVLFGLAASYLRTAINPLGGEWRATFVVGDEPALTTDLYQPFGPRALYFFAPSLNFESRLYNGFVDGERVTEATIREAELELGIGRELLSWSEFRFGARIARGKTELRVGNPLLLPEDEDFRRGELFARFFVDTLDNISFPRSGTLSTIEWRGSRDDRLAGDSNFDQLLTRAVHANTWGRHTLLTTLRYDATISGTASVHRLVRIGGFLDLSGLNPNELTGQHAVRIGTSYYRRIGDLALFPAFAGISLELGNSFQFRGDISADASILGGSLWAGVNTPVGPVYVAYGMAEDDRDAFYVYLGRIF